MRYFLILFCFQLQQVAIAQITLKECLNAGISNKSMVKSAKAEEVIAFLQRVDNQKKYLPQISMDYDYRLNLIIPAQVIPIGQFAAVPTDELRAIQFGTNWQQNAGITLYQPLLNRSLKSQIKEDRWNEELSVIDIERAEQELSLEILFTYNRILTFAFEEEEAIADTLRSYASLKIIEDKFAEGQVLKTEVNNALINHNTNLSNLSNTQSVLLNEKINLFYLTEIPLERILEAHFNPIPFGLFEESVDVPELKKQVSFRELETRKNLLLQQIKTEKTKYSPTIGFQGFLGANHFSMDFAPFAANTWFGNSYIGLFFSLPVFSPDKSYNKTKQLKNQLNILDNQQHELEVQNRQEWYQANVEIERIQSELKLSQNSLSLLEENVLIYQQRLLNDQIGALDLNIQEAELQKLKKRVDVLNEQLNRALIERLYISGDLYERLASLIN